VNTDLADDALRKCQISSLPRFKEFPVELVGLPGAGKSTLAGMLSVREGRKVTGRFELRERTTLEVLSVAANFWRVFHPGVYVLASIMLMPKIGRRARCSRGIVVLKEATKNYFVRTERDGLILDQGLMQSVAAMLSYSRPVCREKMRRMLRGLYADLWPKTLIFVEVEPVDAYEGLVARRRGSGHNRTDLDSWGRADSLVFLEKQKQLINQLCICAEEFTDVVRVRRTDGKFEACAS